MRKWIKLIRSLEVNLVPPSHYLRLNQVWLRNDRAKCQVMFNAFKA